VKGFSVAKNKPRKAKAAKRNAKAAPPPSDEQLDETIDDASASAPDDETSDAHEGDEADAGDDTPPAGQCMKCGHDGFSTVGPVLVQRFRGDVFTGRRPMQIRRRRVRCTKCGQIRIAKSDLESMRVG
jgi:hypothetical protein